MQPKHMLRILLEPDLSSYTDEAYEADLIRIPSWRREKAMAYRFPADRKRCVRAYMLLWDGLRREYGLEGAPVFDFGEHEKPLLRGFPDIHFSLSHTGNAVLCALSERPVGADIEMIRSRNLELLHSVFSEREQEALLRSEHPEILFTEFWTRKESCLKLTGEGLAGTHTVRDTPTEDTDRFRFETVIREKEGFVYSVCQWQTDKNE